MFGFNDEVLIDLIQWVVPLGDISFDVVKVVGLQFVIIAKKAYKPTNDIEIKDGFQHYSKEIKIKSRMHFVAACLKNTS